MKSMPYFALFLVATSLLAGSADAQNTHGEANSESSAEAVPRAILPDAALEHAIDEIRYKVAPVNGGFRANNPAQHFTTTFFNSSTTIQTLDGPLELRLSNYGEPRTTIAEGKKVEQTYRGLREWFLNDAAGLEQGFVVDDKPAIPVIQVSVNDGWNIEARSDGLSLSKGATTLKYGALKAWDARGTLLNAQMRPTDGGFEIRVEDADAVYPVTVDPELTQQATLTDPSGSYLGYSVSLSSDGNTAIVGAPDTTIGGNTYQGAAFIFTRSNGAWAKSAELTAPSTGSEAGAASDDFGNSVALSADGTTAIVGAPYKLLGTIRPGAVFVFKLGGGVWSQSAFLTNNVNGQTYGAFVAVSGNAGFVLVGATISANAYIYGPTATSQLGLQANFTGPSGVSNFGETGALSTEGSVALIGQSGSFSVYTRSGTTWTLQQSLSATPYFQPAFGSAVSLNGAGNIAVVGSSSENSDQGAAYVYANQGGVWTQQARLADPNPDIPLGDGGTVNDYFGSSVALSSDGTTALIGEIGKPGAVVASGAAYLFNGNGSSWSVVQYIVDPNTTVPPGDPADNFGWAVSLNSNGATAVIGSLQASGQRPRKGRAYAFYVPRITITANLTGLPFTVTGTNCQGGSYSTPAILNWTPGAACTVTFATPISGIPTTQYVFTTWENASTDPSRFIVAPTADTTYTASFKTQYQLSTQASPILGGGITPATAFFDAGTKITVTATARAGYVFNSFTGALTGNTNPQKIILNAPATVTANFRKILLK